MLVKEPAKIRRNAIDLHRIQPFRRVHEIGDIVVERRNGKPADLFRQHQAQECRDCGKDSGEGSHGGNTADVVRRSFVGSS